MKFVCLICILSFCLIIPTNAQTSSQTFLQKRVASIELGAQSISELLSLLAEKYDIPIANEASSQTTNRNVASRLTLELRDVSVEEVLNTMFENQPDYRWRLVDGVISISSEKLHEPILDTVIEKFSVSNGTINDFKHTIERQPEIQIALSKSNLEFTELTMLPSGKTNASCKYSLAMNNATIRQILNRLILQTEGHYWTFVRLGDNSQIWIIIR